MTVADVRAAKRTRKRPPAASKQDLRAWLEALRAAGEVQEINGAEREAEIGGIVDLYMRKMGNPAVLFDDIPGYPRGHRILANILTSVRRINLTLGMPIDGSAIELVSYWRKYMKEARSIPPVTVTSGPLLENVSSGKDVNIQTIPTPRWHEHDGGYYIGTGCMVIMKDPDTGWINYGAYRVQSHGPDLATVMCSKGKHGDLIKRRYHERGEPCPVAVVVGMHPALFMVAGLEIPYGKNEYDVAGGLIGEPIEVIKGAAHRAAHSGAGGDRLRGLRPPERSDRRGAARRVDRLLCRRPEEGAGDPHRDLHAPQRSDPARRDPRCAA
jgi:UbiD family decarboxylase